MQINVFSDWRACGGSLTPAHNYPSECSGRGAAATAAVRVRDEQLGAFLDGLTARNRERDTVVVSSATTAGASGTRASG